jgi:MFS transporter, SHS family, sialic acid transporter
MQRLMTAVVKPPDVALPWYRQVNREQWRAFAATFFGWVLDGFDFTILTFVLIDKAARCGCSPAQR